MVEPESSPETPCALERGKSFLFGLKTTKLPNITTCVFVRVMHRDKRILCPGLRSLGSFTMSSHIAMAATLAPHQRTFVTLR